MVLLAAACASEQKKVPATRSAEKSGGSNVFPGERGFDPCLFNVSVSVKMMFIKNHKELLDAIKS
ncbi:MAG: hypothetical protein OEY36_03800 [Gammaproteobacteria bacterium]|nr:hypothetical protein [Gammaproteobacteria bacterium]